MSGLTNTVRIQLRHTRRHMSSTSTFVKFDQLLHQRRTQAQKTLLIQVSSASSVPDVKSYLFNEFGPLDALYHYSLPEKGKQNTVSFISSRTGHVHWVLAEFKKKEDFQSALQTCRHAEGTLPFQSSMCWFSQRVEGDRVTSKSKEKIPTEQLQKSSGTVDFSKAKSLSDQIKVLEDSMKVTELGIRVRFLVANHLEQAVEKFFPSGCVLPFGSTVSGIGRQGGDLDLVLLPDKTEIFPVEAQRKGKSRLWSQTKLYSGGSSGNSRFQVQRVMETVADVIQLFVPGCIQVQRILQARVPILRFWSEFTELQCDLSMTNSSGIHMSEIIYIMASIDHRFPSLLCAIRTWASARKITNPVPGRQPTNFMLVLLLIHFLQCKKILPTLDVLFNNPGKGDARVTSDGIDCGFLRDPEKIMTFFSPQNKSSSLAELLFEFYEFYSEFDFNTKGISLFTGGAWGKPDSGAMYLQNPLERHLNVARNVSREELSRFKNECCAALWKLETSVAKSEENSSLQPGITLNDLLLTPQLDKSLHTSLKMKELLSE